VKTNEHAEVIKVEVADGDEWHAVAKLRGLYFATFGKTKQAAAKAAQSLAKTHWDCVDSGRFYLGMTVNQWAMPDGSTESDVVVAIRRRKGREYATLERRTVPRHA
jgi:hypothetical protein